MSDFLATILEAKRRAIAAAAARHPLAELRERADERRRDGRRPFAAALEAPGVRIIAEIKRASPSRGAIRPTLDAVVTARAYEAGGAAAISVLTEEDYFKGSVSDLQAARAAVALPLLRKDFIIDEYQLYESALTGADCLLLIVRILSDEQLRKFYELALALGLETLVEAYDENDIKRALPLRPRLLAINNRNLRHFDMQADNAARLVALCGDESIVVAASGIMGRADIERALSAGLRHFLVGEALARANDAAALLRELRGEPS